MKLTKAEREKCGVIAENLNGAFDWQDTPQGRAYWKEVYYNLLKLEREEQSSVSEEAKP